MRLFSSRAKTKWLAQSHLIRKNLKEQEQSFLNDSLSSVVSRIQPLLSSVLRLDLGRSSSMASLFQIYGSSFPWVPLLYWKFMFSPPTKNVSWSSLTPPPPFLYTSFALHTFSCHCLLFVVTTGTQRQGSPFSSPSFLATLESLPSHKLQILGKVILSSQLSIWKRTDGPA